MIKKMYSLFLAFLITILVGQVFVAPISAASPSPKITPSPTTSPQPLPLEETLDSTASSQLTLETTAKLKERIEKIVEERRDQIMGVVSNFGKVRKGFVGEVQRVSAETITIKTNKGPQILALNEDVIMTKAGKPIEVSAIAIGEWAIVIGTVEDDAFTPELIDISSKSLRPKSQLVLLGSIKEINTTGRTKTLSSLLIEPRAGTGEQKLLITKQTEYLDSDGNSIKSSDIVTDMQAVVVAQEGANDMEITSLKLLGAIGGTR